MFINHSIWGKISFLFLIQGLLFLTLRVIFINLSKYSFYEEISLIDNIATVVDIWLIISAICSLILGLIAILKKNTVKIFPTISLSIVSFMLYLMLLMILQETFTKHRVTNGVVTNYGIFEIPKRILPDGTERRYYAERYLQSNTDEIPAIIGARFGFNYVIHGEPDDGTIEMIKIIKYPSPGMKINNKIVLADTIDVTVFLNELAYSGFFFEEDYELIPGIWTIDLCYKGNTIISKKFNIVVNSNPSS